MCPGAFVRVLFPTHEAPVRPGLLHIGYVLGVAAEYVVVAYTTSQPWPANTPLPAGARAFDAAEAARLNQSRAFLLRVDVLARLPLTRAWFPELDQPGGGIVAIAPASLRTEITRLATNLARRRRELLEMRGPDA
jgi:hypothetical protein